MLPASKGGVCWDPGCAWLKQLALPSLQWGQSPSQGMAPPRLPAFSIMGLQWGPVYRLFTHLLPGDTQGCSAFVQRHSLPRKSPMLWCISESIVPTFRPGSRERSLQSSEDATLGNKSLLIKTHHVLITQSQYSQHCICRSRYWCLASCDSECHKCTYLFPLLTFGIFFWTADY